MCRGQVRGSCPPGATLPTTSIAAVGTRMVGAARLRLVDGSRAARRYSGARSTNSQSSLAVRGARGSFLCYVLLITLLVFVSRGLLNRSPLEVNNNQRVSSTSRYTINICTECVSREIRLFSRFFPYFTRSSLLYFYVFVLGRTVPFGHNPRLYVTVCSMCNQ